MAKYDHKNTVLKINGVHTQIDPSTIAVDNDRTQVVILHINGNKVYLDKAKLDEDGRLVVSTSDKVTFCSSESKSLVYGACL